MKNLIAGLFVLAFSSFCYAQDVPSQSTEEVSVVSVSYTKKSPRNRQAFEDDVPFLSETNTTTSNRPQTSSRDAIKAKKTNVPIDDAGKTEIRTIVQLKNNTQKKVTSIEYNFIVVQKDNGEELQRYSFTNNSDVKANKTKTLSDVITGSEANSYFKKLTSTISFKAEIIRVTYDDESVWTP